FPDGTYSVADDPAGAISPKIARILDQAWKLTGSQKFDAARERLSALDKIAKKSPYEMASIADLKASIDFGLGDYVGAADSFAAGVETGALPRDRVATRLAAMTQLYFRTRNYAKAIDAGNRYVRDVGKDADILMIVGEAHYIGRDFPHA